MRLAAHQPNYLPYLGFIEKAKRCDVFVIADTDQYTRGSFIDYNYIAGANGKVRLKEPVSGGFGSRISEMRTCDEQGWRRRHLKSIECCYRKARNFDWVYGELETALCAETDNLAELNTGIIRALFRMFEIKADVVLQSELCQTGTGEELIVNLCRAVGADTYVSGAGAKAYQTESDFARMGIALEYAEFRQDAYPQMTAGQFVPNLSAIDYLMNRKENTCRSSRC